MAQRLSSYVSWSGLTNCRFLLQIVQVPGRPVYSVRMPFHVCLKAFCTCFRRSSADIFCGGWSFWYDAFLS